jgi:hypothetical protein
LKSYFAGHLRLVRTILKERVDCIFINPSAHGMHEYKYLFKVTMILFKIFYGYPFVLNSIPSN